MIPDNPPHEPADLGQPMNRQARIPEEAAGRRFDQVLAELFPDFSRSRLAAWVRAGRARLDGVSVKPRHKVAGGELVELEPVPEPDERVRPEPIALDIVHEDTSLLVVNKPPGLVVHPAAGNRAGTLQNALLHREPGLAAVPRAGIVHRLDKDTSGLMVVARTLAAHKSLVDQLQDRSMGREYDVVVRGVVTAGGTVDAPIGRHPGQRKRMAVVEDGKPAVSVYRVRERYRAHSRMTVKLQSGRTHQIRVHMAHVRHPVVGDPVYGGRPAFPKGVSEALREALERFPRQALHAETLRLIHPETGEEAAWSVSCPADMEALIGRLREDAEAE